MVKLGFLYYIKKKSEAQLVLPMCKNNSSANSIFYHTRSDNLHIYCHCPGKQFASP